MSFPIIDLHCDLLCCVEADEKKLNFESSGTNCSVHQLRKGGVALQVFAVAAVTLPNSSLKGLRQIDLYQELLNKHKNQIASFRDFNLGSSKTHGILAIENASALIEEDEDLDLFFQRFEHALSHEEILYVSLTWNQENRFGGGNSSEVGLKKDGEEVLRFLSEKKTSIDLSHTSDRLAFDILNFIDKENLLIVPMASHSNCREIKNIKRNLPDDLLREVLRLKGVIGCNFVKRFVGESPYDFIRHFEHAIELGAGDQICLGADFYGGIDVPKHLIPEISYPIFQKDFSNSSCYPKFLGLLEKHFSKKQVEKIANINILTFLKNLKLF
jgi:membrane dipeptidase